MAYGTLPNIANAGHEPTPDARAEQIAHNLLKLPRSHFTVIDGTCGEGNLLVPFQSNAHAEQSLRREEAAVAEEEAQAQAAWRALPEAEQTKAALQLFRRQYRTPKTMLGKKQPAWVQPFKVAWRRNPRVGPSLPHALPQAITTPKRVITTWEREVGGAWPEAEIVVVEDYTDIARAIARAKRASQSTCYASGTHYAGSLELF